MKKIKEYRWVIFIIVLAILLLVLAFYATKWQMLLYHDLAEAWGLAK